MTRLSSSVLTWSVSALGCSLTSFTVTVTMIVASTAVADVAPRILPVADLDGDRAALRGFVVERVLRAQLARPGINAEGGAALSDGVGQGVALFVSCRDGRADCPARRRVLVD